MKLKFDEENQPVYIIAEMSANHRGSLARAKEIVYAAKESGADCIKIQTYTPDTLTINCANKFFQICDGTWRGENLYSLYEKAYTPWEWQAELKKEADRIGIDFLSTAFDKTSVEFLENLGVAFYKIASFELIDLPLIELVASKGKPILLSTGMGTLEEIEDAVNTVKAQGNEQLILLKCASAYPAVAENMNLFTMGDMAQRFRIPVGLSDHSLGSVAAIAAVAMGAKVIEKHFCISRTIENPDASFSMEPSEFLQMAKDIRATERAAGCIKYGPTEEENNNLRFRKSVFAVADIRAGELITDNNIRVIRPGYGLKPKEYKSVLGMTALCDIQFGTPLDYSMLKEKD